MIEQIFPLYQGDEKKINKVILDENVQYLQMVFNQNEGLPEHFSNSNLYMTVIRGCLTIALNDEPANEYKAKTMLKIPVNTKMNVNNRHSETLELIIVKVPAPIVTRN